MTVPTLLPRLAAAVAPHDTLTHPYYRAWTMGQLTLSDLAGYAAQYLLQVEALPALLRAARAQAQDAQARAALERNLAEEEGRLAPAGVGAQAAAHRELWLQFAEGVGASREEVRAARPHLDTQAAVALLHDVVGQGEVQALGALWAYEAQTARVAAEKRRGLADRYALTEPRAVAFFAVHEELDVHHAGELLAALDAACARTPGGEELACAAAKAAALAQWRFLDGVEAERRRHA